MTHSYGALFQRYFDNNSSGQSYKHFTSVNNDPRVVNYDRKVLYKIDHSCIKIGSKILPHNMTVQVLAKFICPIRNSDHFSSPMNNVKQTRMTYCRRINKPINYAHIWESSG